MSTATVQIVGSLEQETAHQQDKESRENLLKLYKKLKCEAIELERQAYIREQSRTFQEFESARTSSSLSLDKNYKDELLQELNMLRICGMRIHCKDDFLIVDLNSQLKGKHCATYNLCIGKQGNEYFIESSSLPPGIDAYSIIKNFEASHPLHLVDFVQYIFLCCQAFHNRNQQYFELKEFIKDRGLKVHTSSPSHRRLVMLRHGSDLNLNEENSRNAITLKYAIYKYQPSSVEWERKGQTSREQSMINYCKKELKDLSLVDAFNKLIPKNCKSSESVFLNLLGEEEQLGLGGDDATNHSSANSESDSKLDLDRIILKSSHVQSLSLNDAALHEKENNSKIPLKVSSKEKVVAQPSETQNIRAEKPRNNFLHSKSQVIESEQDATSSKSHPQSLSANFGRSGPEEVIDDRANTATKSYTRSLLIEYDTQSCQKSPTESSKCGRGQILKVSNTVEPREPYQLNSSASPKGPWPEKEQRESSHSFTGRQLRKRKAPLSLDQEHERRKVQGCTSPPSSPKKGLKR